MSEVVKPEAYSVVRPNNSSFYGSRPQVLLHHDGGGQRFPAFNRELGKT